MNLILNTKRKIKKISNTLAISIISSNDVKYFCLNAGNCGSKYIVELLKANGCTRCYHEKKPTLNELGVRYYHHKELRKRIIRLLKHTRTNVFFESSNRLFAFASEILEAFPKSRFIFLHRDARDAVRGALNHPNLDEDFKENIRTKEGDLAGPHDADIFSKTCHYWANINNRILNDLRGLNYLTLRFDDLISGKVENLEKFMGTKLYIKRIPPVNVKPKKSGLPYPFYKDWPKENKDIFWKICGKTMIDLGYI